MSASEGAVLFKEEELLALRGAVVVREGASPSTVAKFRFFHVLFDDL